MPIAQVTEIHEKFNDLRRKASFWIETIKSFPKVCAPACWKPCFEKAILTHDKLWSFQQENRKLLESCQGFSREIIGDIAFDIAMLYFNYYLRDFSKQHLRRAMAFFDAINNRAYFKPESEKHGKFIFAFAIAKLLSGELIRCRELMTSTSSSFSSQSSLDSSFSVSQKQFVLKDLDYLIRDTCNGSFFESGPVSISTSCKEANCKTKSFISLVRSDSALFGELSVGGVLLNYLADRCLEGVNRVFLADPSPIEAISASFEAMRSTCSNDILFLHTNCLVQRTIEGKDVWFLEQEGSTAGNDDDKILSLDELSLLRRRVFVLSEHPLNAFISIPDNVYLMSPVSPAWGILSCFSIESSLYRISLKLSASHKRRPGKIEDIIRTQGQVFLKFIRSTCAELLIRDPKIGPYTNCPLCFHLLMTHLMSAYLHYWMECKVNSLINRNYPIASLQMYPKTLQCPTQETLSFLDSLVNY